MRNKIYDEPNFFAKYCSMKRSIKGLSGAGEWLTLEKMLPDFKDKRVLDLGCGFGWHCQYAYEKGAKKVIGVDISEKMISVAREKTSKDIEYIINPIEDLEFPDNTFDIVISSLAFHYIESFESIAKSIHKWLIDNGDFVFSVEHPVFTAYGSQDWFYDSQGNILHFPVDNYFIEGEREAIFLGEKVKKYHRTLTTYIYSLLSNGFSITGLKEPQPSLEMLQEDIKMKNELRRPMMLIIAAKKIS